MGETVTASDDNANANDVVIGVATFDTVDKKDVLGPKKKKALGFSLREY